MSIDTNHERATSHPIDVDPETKREIDEAIPGINIFDEIEKLERAEPRLAPEIIEKAIHAYFRDILKLPPEERSGWWEHYLKEALPKETAEGERLRWLGQVARWMYTDNPQFRDPSTTMTEREEAIYARRDITEALDARQRATSGVSPREPAWDAPVEPPQLARDGQR